MTEFSLQYLLCGQFFVFTNGLSILTGSPQQAVLGQNVNVTLKCVVDVDNTVVSWVKGVQNVGNIQVDSSGNCTGMPLDTPYIFQCNPISRTYYMIIQIRNLTESEKSVKWQCRRLFDVSNSNPWSISIAVPVSTVTITPAGINNEANIIIGDTHTFSCSTDSTRPVAWIQWYIGGENLTNQAQPQTPQPDGDRFTSTSRMVYIGKDEDHNKHIYCEAVNIEGRDKVKSSEITINVELPLKAVTITPPADVISVIKGDIQTFDCTTNSCRPAASIQWYIGTQNVTNQAQPQTPQPDGDKFISSSRLMYTGKDADHNKHIYCEAVNVVRRDKVKSTNKSIHILVPVTTVTFTPAGNNNVIDVVLGHAHTFNCFTDLGRPAARIQWFIGGKNTTDQAQAQTPQPDGDKYISLSRLLYIGKVDDHNVHIYCEAINIEGRAKIKSIESSIFIQYKPFLDHSRPYSPSLISATENTPLLIKVTVIANPTPTIEWTFKAEADMISCNLSTLLSNTSTKEYSTLSFILIDNLTTSNFGEYIISARNTAGVFFRRFVVMEEASLRQEMFTRSKENTGIFVAGIVTLVVGLLSLAAAVLCIVRNSFQKKAFKSSPSDEYTDVQRSNPVFTDEYTTLQSEIESRSTQKQTVNTYDECVGKSEPHAYSSLDIVESELTQHQKKGY